MLFRSRIPDTSILSGSITTDRDHYHSLEPWDMVGRHQFENAAMAISIAEGLNNFGLAITTDEICLGIGRAKHPGRLEYVDNRYLLDGAHNAAGAKALRAYLDEFEKRPITMVFGAMKEKDVSAIASALFHKAETLILTSPSNLRAVNAKDLAVRIPKEARWSFRPRERRIERTRNLTPCGDGLRSRRPMSC